MEREKVDKAALGYDYQSETEKHQSQKGEATLSMSSSDSWSNADRKCVCVCVQITPQASGVVTASRPTAWTRSALRIDVLRSNTIIGHTGAFFMIL